MWRFRFLVGYELRTFSSQAVKTIQAPVIEGSVIYTPTGLTTLTGTVSRRIEDSSDDSIVGYTATTLQLRMDHEYSRNVLIAATVGVGLSDYSQSAGQQTSYSFGTSATWLINRNMQLVGSYDYNARRATGTSTTLLDNSFALGSSYSENRYLLQIKIGL